MFWILTPLRLSIQFNSEKYDYFRKTVESGKVSHPIWACRSIYLQKPGWIVKHGSDVIIQTNCNKQNGVVENVLLFQACSQALNFKTKLLRYFSSYFSQNTLMLSDSRRVSIICIIIWLAPWAGKMNQILRIDWLYSYPSGQDGAILPSRDYPQCPARRIQWTESHVINPILAKFVRSRWLDIALVQVFREFMDLEFFSVHKLAKRRTWAILSHLDRTNKNLYF